MHYITQALQFWTNTRQDQLSPEDSDKAVEVLNAVLRSEMHRLGVDVVYNADKTSMLLSTCPRQRWSDVE